MEKTKVKRVCTALQVNIPKREMVEGVMKYAIYMTKIYDKTKSATILKRYNEFLQLHMDLTQSGFLYLPAFPPKTLFASEDDLNRRQINLEIYLKQLTDRKDTRNSKCVRGFLNLEQFCPEIIYLTPTMLGVIRHGKNKYVTHCQSMPRANLFVLAVYDRGNKTSCFEIYSFRRIGVVSDKFLLRSPSVA